MATKQPELPVLIVEDDVPTQNLLRAMLHRSGYASEVASNGRQAIERLKGEPFAAVILDMMMPEVGGQAVVEFLGTMARPVPVIVCSAAGPSALTGFDPAVVKSIIRKPFDIDQFTATIQKVTDMEEPGTRILIVDDDIIARYTIRTLLDPAEVSEAETGDEALAMIRQAPPDVVLLDLILPGISGEEVLRQMAENDTMRALPVVVITSRVLTEQERLQLLEDAVAVIYKGDLSRDTLRDALARALGRS